MTRTPRGTLVVAAVALLALLRHSLWSSSTFVGARVTLAPSMRDAPVARHVYESAEAIWDDEIEEVLTKKDFVKEEPPSDEELDAETSDEPRPMKRRLLSREKRGTLSYARRELREEAERLRPHIEPLLYKKYLSAKEITFVLNRKGKDLRHLLYKPRVGLPVFTEHKVMRLMRRSKNVDGVRLNNYIRPQYLPPNAPGAPYPKPMEDVYAEVPPLGWQDMEEYKHLRREEREKAYNARQESSRILSQKAVMGAD
ncbi:unnamed protein product [Durusdinium trenchii]|uniref:Uncharacterized protein n=1 Tax=Durusdinium trenchii TaxID=1381693 RepID=A0ABP0LLI1_9DINO